jgi:hypothetical protein
LFEQLKIVDKPSKTKTGQYSTAEDVLSKLENKHPIVRLILDYRELVKLKNTYVDVLPQLINPRTGRIHSTFNQVVAVTGRLSSDNPNLQNIPIRTARGREIRKAFVPRSEEYVLLSADYSQIELRIIAELSGDTGMLEAFNSGEDIHAATAAKVYGVPIAEVTSDMRRSAKMVNFGIIYGLSAFGLADRLNISRTEAKGIIDKAVVAKKTKLVKHSTYYTIEPNIAVHAKLQEKKAVVFGSDLIPGGAVITKTFASSSFSQEDDTLTVTVSNIITKLEHVYGDKDVYFLIRNDKTRKSIKEYPGIRVLASYKKRINKNVIVVER